MKKRDRMNRTLKRRLLVLATGNEKSANEVNINEFDLSKDRSVL